MQVSAKKNIKAGYFSPFIIEALVCHEKNNYCLCKKAKYNVERPGLNFE